MSHLERLGVAAVLLAWTWTPGPHSQPADAAARAEHLLAAPAGERERLASEPDFATAEVARALNAAGDEARTAAEYARAVECHDLAAAIARRAGAETELGRALNGGADARFRLSDVAGLALAEESIRVHEKLGDPSGLAEAWNNAASLQSIQGLDPRPAYEKALELWTAANDASGVARALNNLGNLYRSRGDNERALDYLERSRDTLVALNDSRRAAIVMDNISILLFHQGRYPEALEEAERALAIQEQLGHRPGIAKSLDSIGNVYVAQGAYARALELFQRSLKLREAFGGVVEAAESWNNIGLVHLSQGDNELAIESFREALRRNKAIGEQMLVASALINIGSAAASLGQRPRAEANYRESLRIAELAGATDLVATALQGLADLAFEGGNTRDAESLMARVLAISEGLADRAAAAHALNGLAAIDLAASRPRAALDRGRRAAEIARAIEQLDQLWAAHTWMGRAYRRLDDAAGARRELETAVGILEGLRKQVVARPVGGERFLGERLSPYHDLIALELAEGADARALELAERAKARVLADLLQRGPGDIRGAMTDAERSEERRLRSSLLFLNQRLQAARLEPEPDAAVLARLESDRAARRLEYDAFETALYSSHPELRVQRGAVSAFLTADAERLLSSPSTAILEYVVTDDTLHLFVLTRTATGTEIEAVSQKTDARSLATSTRRLRERIAARDLAFGEDARRLHETLLAPAARRIAGKRHLIVVPDGPLWDVPFQALVDAEGRYVVESAAVSYAPSLTVLREMVRANARPHAARTVLAMGKADFGSDAAAPPVALMSDLGPLPDAERQVRQIGELYGPDRSATYVGAEAREDRFKSEAPRYSILHLASHGVLDEASPFYSHIVLSPGAGGSSADGLLEAWELLDLGLDAELAILSACETGRGRISAGEGTVGTVWALFVGGAEATVVSQWKVESSSTTELMSAFHRGLAGRDGGKAELLREATLSVLRTPRWAHPFYWAPFVLVGQPF